MLAIKYKQTVTFNPQSNEKQIKGLLYDSPAFYKTAHQAKVRMIKPINVFGYIKIKYEVLDKEEK